MPALTGVVHDAGVPRPSLDLDQAHAAGAERFRAVGGTQLRNVDAGLGCGAHDRRALGHGDGYAVDLDLNGGLAGTAGVPIVGRSSHGVMGAEAVHDDIAEPLDRSLRGSA